MTETTLISAFVLGLMGASHCLGMCGGIISSLSIATNEHRKWFNISYYQLGRILSYGFFGFVAGFIGQQANNLIDFPLLATISAILLILMGFYISRLWMALTYLEKAGKLLWNKLSPLSKKLLPVTNGRQALLLGVLWGWLPCGLVYSAVSYAITTANPLNSATYMLFFGLGTLPATLAAGAASAKLKQYLNHPVSRWLTAILFVGFGIFTLYSLYWSGAGSHHHHH